MLRLGVSFRPSALRFVLVLCSVSIRYVSPCCLHSPPCVTLRLVVFIRLDALRLHLGALIRFDVFRCVTLRLVVFIPLYAPRRVLAISFVSMGYIYIYEKYTIT